MLADGILDFVAIPLARAVVAAGSEHAFWLPGAADEAKARLNDERMVEHIGRHELLLIDENGAATVKAYTPPAA